MIPAPSVLLPRRAAGAAVLSILVTAGTGVAQVPIPNHPGLLGGTVSSQAVALSPVTPAGLISSNGTWFVVGN